MSAWDLASDINICTLTPRSTHSKTMASSLLPVALRFRGYQDNTRSKIVCPRHEATSLVEGVTVELTIERRERRPELCKLG